MEIDVLTLFPDWFGWFSGQRHVRNAEALVRTWFGGADVEAAVDHHGVGGDDFKAEPLGEPQGEGAFAARRRATPALLAAAPALVRQAEAVMPTARRCGTTTPCAPNAAAERTTAPRLRGSVTPSMATTSGGRPELRARSSRSSGWAYS